MFDTVCHQHATLAAMLPNDADRLGSGVIGDDQPDPHENHQNADPSREALADRIHTETTSA